MTRLEYSVEFAIFFMKEKSLMNMKNQKHTLVIEMNLKKLKNKRKQFTFSIQLQRENQIDITSFSPSFLKNCVQVKLSKREEKYIVCETFIEKNVQTFLL